MENLEKKILTTNDFGLVKLLHEGLIERINDGILAIENEDYEELNKSINISRDILTELILVFSKDDDLSTNLRSIYLFINKYITESEIKKDKDHLEEIKKVIFPLLAAFGDLEKSEEGRVVSGLTYGKSNLDDHKLGGNRTFEV